MKYYLVIIFFIFNSCKGSSHSSASYSAIFPLTKTKIQNLLKNPPVAPTRLKEETINGCISVPASGFFQRLFVGSESTGEQCSITIHSENKISLSFLNQANIPLIDTSTPQVSTDTFVAELENGQVLIVQQVNGRVVGLTHTIYDSEGMVVYQGYGKGDYIRVCLPTTSPCMKTPN